MRSPRDEHELSVRLGKVFRQVQEDLRDPGGAFDREQARQRDAARARRRSGDAEILSIIEAHLVGDEARYLHEGPEDILAQAWEAIQAAVAELEA